MLITQDSHFSATLQDAVPEDMQKEELMESITKGNFSLRILYEQLANIQKMGPVGQVMSMIPGLSNSNLFSQVPICSPSAHSDQSTHPESVLNSRCKPVCPRISVDQQ